MFGLSEPSVVLFDVTKSEEPPGTIHYWKQGPYIKRASGDWVPLSAEDDGKETGRFGPIYRRFHHKPEAALAFLQKEKKGEAVAAIHKEGIGDIDFVWGEPGDPAKNYRNGYGISHIIARREAVGHDSAHFIKHLPDTIREGEVFRKKEKDETVFIRHPEGSKEILIRLNWFGERKVWLLTGYFTEPEVGGKALKSRIGILQGYPGSMDAAPDLPVYKNIGNSPPSQDRLDVRKARGFPIMCDYCKDWSTHNPILRVFASYEEFARSPFYGGGDHVINDPYAEFATWPGKTNANRHFEDWWVCVPVHPNCSHGYQPYDPEESEYDFSDTFSKVEEEIRDEQDRAAETRKSAFYSIGVFQAATCACCDPSIHRPEVSWTREYLSRSNLINRGEK